MWKCGEYYLWHPATKDFPSPSRVPPLGFEPRPQRLRAACANQLTLWRRKEPLAPISLSFQQEGIQQQQQESGVAENDSLQILELRTESIVVVTVEALFPFQFVYVHDRNRTCKTLRPLAPQASVYTYFTTWT